MQHSIYKTNCNFGFITILCIECISFQSYISELNMSTLLFKNHLHSLNSKLLITLYYIVRKVIFFPSVRH